MIWKAFKLGWGNRRSVNEWLKQTFFFGGTVSSEWSPEGANDLQIDHTFISFQSRKNEKRRGNGICLRCTPAWKQQKDPKIPSRHVKGRHCFHLESPCGAENTLTQPWYYCFCSLSPQLCLSLVMLSLPRWIIYLCLWSGSALRYQFACCFISAGAVSSCLKNSQKLFFIRHGPGARSPFGRRELFYGR